MSKGKVLVAMSGGIDSTVTAIMLHKQGYEVIGITMKTWDYATSGGSKKETGCCSLDSINDARAIAVELGFPHYIVDIRPEFGGAVINNFIEEYLAGRTPNPCVLCNTHIKWEALLKRADDMGCEFIATGHYAKHNYSAEHDRYFVTAAVDQRKDQSYVLWGLSQESLKRSIFPLGPFEKSEIRQMAHDWGYEEIAKKAESFEICFVPDNDYRGFLKRNVDGLQEEVAGGTFVDVEGNILGQHEGYPFFTIGQRKGLGLAFGEPMYVTEIRPETNTVVLGKEKELVRKGMYVHNVTLQKIGEIEDGMEALVKVRYKDKGAMAKLYKEDSMVRVEFYTDVKGIAPGQSAVFYDGDDVLGGGNIHSSFHL
ncbi:MAG: tRNA 2-thiouridine(34) synthase MnmA [Saprospiraceae bacterium]|nr:tRNA 2-thiouridine(34) synthase MnmA [Saprospiraceae bacterium]